MIKTWTVDCRVLAFGRTWVDAETEDEARKKIMAGVANGSLIIDTATAKIDAVEDCFETIYEA